MIYFENPNFPLLFQFHGMVAKGHEARVMMMLNDKVVMHMYDKDYSGNNER